MLQLDTQKNDLLIMAKKPLYKTRKLELGKLYKHHYRPGWVTLYYPIGSSLNKKDEAIGFFEKNDIVLVIDIKENFIRERIMTVLTDKNVVADLVWNYNSWIPLEEIK